MFGMVVKYLTLALVAYVAWVGVGTGVWQALSVQKALAKSVPADRNMPMSMAIRETKERVTRELELLKVKSVAIDDLTLEKDDKGWVVLLDYTDKRKVFATVALETAFTLNSAEKNPFSKRNVDSEQQ